MNDSRYSRQVRFGGVGEDGQERLAQARVTVCGCGALGSVIADTLARSGVGQLRIVDRDFVELNNLQRQLLFTEQDVKDCLPKAEAAARHLQKVNSDVVIEPAVCDLDASNISRLCGDADVILDGTDNFETRLLINDFGRREQKPWIYAGCIGSEGQSMAVLPDEPPCLRCLIGNPPAPGTTPTCETAGILSPVVSAIASFQCIEALKLLLGKPERLHRKLLAIDLWNNRVRYLSLAKLREQTDCPVCKEGRYDWLEGDHASRTVSLCGRNAVQVVPPRRHAVDFAALAEQLPSPQDVKVTPFLLRFVIDGFEFSVFADGRAIIKGTDDVAAARTLYARYLGS